VSFWTRATGTSTALRRRPCRKASPSTSATGPYKILANVGLAASGVIFAHASRFGGHSLFVKDRKLQRVCNFLGLRPEQHFVSKGVLAPGEHTVGVEFTRGKAGEHGESRGTAKLYTDDQVVAEGPMRTQAGMFTPSGDGLCVGDDSGDAVSREHKTPGTFQGGRVFFVGVTVERAAYLDLEKEARRFPSVQ
jgi:arylsulfatase